MMDPNKKKSSLPSCNGGKDCEKFQGNEEVGRESA